MNATLYPVAGGRDTIAASVEGDVTEVAHLVDRLTAQLLVGRSRGADARFASLAATTTSSLPALKAYLDGERRWRMRQLDSAVAAFGHAVEYDTAFALAYYRMAVAGSYRFTSPPDAAARALRHSARLPERYRLLVEAFSARDRGAVFEAESLYRKVLASHPDDAEAWFTLAALTHRRLFAHGRPIHAAREAFERVLALEPTHPRALGGLAILDGYEGKHERAVGRMRRILRVDHGEYNVLFRTALALHDGDRADQQRALAELSRSKEDWILLGAGWAGVVTGNRQGGVRVARLVAAHARAPRWRVDALFCIADLELAHGRRSAASAASTEAARIAPLFALHARTALALVPSLESSAADLVDLRQEVMKTRPAERSESLWRTYLLGLLDSRIGNRDAALRSADDLESQSTPLTRADSGSHAAMARDLALTIRADVSWRSGHPRQALAFLARNRRSSWGAARPSAAWVLNGGLAPGYAEPSAYERWMRGELAASVGRPREAIDWFDGLGAAWPGEGMSYFAPSRLRMGALYEGLGEPERAAEQYERVIELWKDADPDLKLVVTEAKKRLTLLVAKSSP
jgi:tetratricopeptide (TPR) repeat protein